MSQSLYFSGTTKSEKHKWLSVHLYYEGNIEQLLKQGVFDFLRKASKEKWIFSYFFIRYWDRGTHIRLRIKTSEGIIQENLKQFLLTYFQNYFKKNPSSRNNNKANLHTKDLAWFPNDSIQFIDYEPEIDRYGGLDAINIAENHFHLSSKVCLSFLNDTKKNTLYEKSLSNAILLHLGLLYAFKLCINDMILLLNAICDSWIYNSIPNDHDDSFIDNKNKIMTVFEVQFEQQKNHIVPYVLKIWQALQDGIDFEKNEFNNWVKENESYANKLADLYQSNKLCIPPNTTYEKYRNHKTAILPILESYIHMTNNRIGIFNIDESYIAYLMATSLRFHDSVVI